VVGSGYAVKTAVNDIVRGNACHTWHAEEDIAEVQVHPPTSVSL